MANLFDYIVWRGDLTLAQSGFNEIDGMILARLSYVPFEWVADALHNTATIGSVAAALLCVPDIENKVTSAEDINLLRALAESPRFCTMELFAYENQLDLESQTQFSAITVRLQDELIYIAFRGTDHTLVGWKEDFNMTFVCPVPAQRLAVDYLAKIAKSVDSKMILGGHSKGGNLAVYAAAFCPPAIQARIQAVYNYDGPGFEEAILRTENYQAICSRVSTFVPQSSIVGMLLEHEEKYTIVHSTQKTGIWQHDVYSWEVQQAHFSYLETVTNSSRFINSTLKAWLAELDYAQREQFIDASYALLTQTNAVTLSDLSGSWFSNAKTILKSVQNLDDSTRKMVTEALRLLVRCTKNEILQVIQRK